MAWLFSGDYNLKDLRIKISRYSKCCSHPGGPGSISAPSSAVWILSPSYPLPHSLMQCLFSSTHPMAGTVLGTEDMKMNKTSSYLSQGAHSLLGRQTYEERNMNVKEKIPAPNSRLPGASSAQLSPCTSLPISSLVWMDLISTCHNPSPSESPP